MKKTLLLGSIFATFLIFNGCSHKGTMNEFNKKYYGGNLQGAYDFAHKKAIKNDDSVLWGFQAGVTGIQLGKKESFNVLESTEQVFNQYEAQGLLSGIFGNVGAVLANENVKTYRGNIYEGVLINYYKALLAMKEGDNALARVEFNRANDRQRRAKDYYQKDIQKALQKQQEEDSNDMSQVNQSATQGALQSQLGNQYIKLHSFKAYNNFINPAVSYVSGLFFFLQADYAKSLDLYKQAYGMTQAEVIDEDIGVLRARQKGDKTSYTWLIIEDGKSPQKEDVSLNFPAYLVSSNVLHIGMSVPALIDGEDFHRGIGVKGDSINQKASLIADLEGVIANEFREQLPFVLTRAMSSAILKAITQSALQEHAGAYGLLAGMIYSAATTSADVRISTVLPNKIYALRIPNKIGDYELFAFHTLLHFSIKEECNTQNSLVLCQKSDNILYIRLRQKDLSYQVLRGASNIQ